MPSEVERALVIAGHGSHRNPDSAAPVHEAVERVRERAAFAEVRPAFWKEEPSLRTVLHTVDADEAIVVPLFVSEGYFVEQVLPREFGLGERDREDLRVRYADPVGTHPAMTDAIAARARRLLDGSSDGGHDSADAGVSTDDVALAVIGHGTERNPNSADAVYDHVSALRDRDEFAAVGAAFMDEAPYVEDVRDRFDADEIAVVPLFVADGFHTQEEIPELLDLTDDAAAGYPVPATVDDRRIRYASAVGTDPLVADVVLERAAEAGADVSELTSGDAGAETDHAGSAEVEASADPPRAVRSDAAAAFLDWIERPGEGGDSGAARARYWGELAVTPAWDDRTATARGRYDLRHREDRGAPIADLERVEVGDLREVVRRADDGRYRPFAGERSLPRGWVLPSLDHEALLRAVATVYPASVEHWASERAGDLDPVDFRTVADRQTGIYECVADCSREEVAGAVDACCGNCAKRRAWDAGDGRSDDADASPDGERGEGTIPCREPCSFLIAAAREFHQHEQIDGGQSTAEPTDEQRTDREQTDQQQPDRTASVPRGDLTDPANRYRVRYRRARRREIPLQP